MFQLSLTFYNAMLQHCHLYVPIIFNMYNAHNSLVCNGVLSSCTVGKCIVIIPKYTKLSQKEDKQIKPKKLTALRLSTNENR